MNYKSALFNDAMNKAVRASRKDGRLRFMYATAYGWKIGLRRVVFQDNYWTNGVEAGTWRAFGQRGEINPRWTVTIAYAS